MCVAFPIIVVKNKQPKTNELFSLFLQAHHVRCASNWLAQREPHQKDATNIRCCLDCLIKFESMNLNFCK